jgi:hypothetical protein
VKLRAALALTGFGLSGCASTVDWYKAEDVRAIEIVAIETPLAVQFCSALLGGIKRACAVRFSNMNRCPVIYLPGDGEAAAHEGGHCLGYDHK